MKTKLLLLAVTVAGIPVLAHAVTLPSPPGVCSNSTLLAAINAVLSSIGLPQIC